MGFRCGIVGLPNVGKSTLLNSIAGREAAITSEIAGTTRDIITVRMDIAGLAVNIHDTAGIRETSDDVEGQGVERALTRAKQADLRVFLRERRDVDLPITFLDGDIIIGAKADLTGDGVSGLTGYGVPDLLKRIEDALKSREAGGIIAIRERHVFAMKDALAYLKAARVMLDATEEPELIAFEIRRAMRSLDALTGRIDVEDLLGEIFSSFCIGK